MLWNFLPLNLYIAADLKKLRFLFGQNIIYIDQFQLILSLKQVFNILMAGFYWICAQILIIRMPKNLYYVCWFDKKFKLYSLLCVCVRAAVNERRGFGTGVQHVLGQGGPGFTSLKILPFRIRYCCLTPIGFLPKTKDVLLYLDNSTCTWT